MKIIIMILFLLQTACATVMKEEWEEIQIDTEPSGAKVTVNNGQICHTPCHLELERGRSFQLQISKEGFKPQEYRINGKSFDPWIWGNLVFIVGFPIGVAIDFYTGYAYDFSPSRIKTQLKGQK